MEVDLVDDSWLVVPHDAPQVSLKLGETVARCSADGDGGCAVPRLDSSPSSSMRLRRLAQGEELGEASPPLTEGGEEPAAVKKSDEAAMAMADEQVEDDEDDEDDDHVKFHEEAPELPSLDGMMAQAPLRGAAAPFGQLRGHSSATLLQKLYSTRSGAARQQAADGQSRRLDAEPPAVNVVEEEAQGVCGWGGTCTCPDGQVYQVMENCDNCATLACVGGVSGLTCGPNAPPGVVNPDGRRVRVTCAPLAFDPTNGTAPLRWSSTATWGGAPPNSSTTELVYIPYGVHILLDVPSVYVRIWVVEGVLTLADEMDINLGAEAIIVNHGELRVGTASAPFTHDATFTLHGHWKTPQLPVFGIKTIALTQGKLLLYGQPKTPWLRLASSALIGENTLMLSAVPDGWAAGDALVVTSNVPELGCTLARDDECQTEERIISSISGATVTLTAPLTYSHTAETVDADGKTVLLTCEVVNLNRNVKIRGSGGSGTAGFGGHVMLLQPTNGVSALHHVELTRMGQLFRVGRYPIHLHAVTEGGGVGDVSATSVVGVSVHHSFNRGINIHGGVGATVSHSTIYKNLGHGT